MGSPLKSVPVGRIRWTVKAFQNLEMAVLYVAEENPQAAGELAKKIHHGVTVLGVHPQIGRPGRCKGTRELLIGGTPYIVPYRIRGQHVEILTVLHGAKKWPLRF
jgi:toxin ParE1/3/4